MPAIVEESKCIGCGSCAQMCPVGAIAMENGKAVVAGVCIECGACEKVCPRGAIRVAK